MNTIFRPTPKVKPPRTQRKLSEQQSRQILLLLKIRQRCLRKINAIMDTAGVVDSKRTREKQIQRIKDLYASP